MTYRPARAGRHATVAIRGLEHHVVRWGPDSNDPLLFLHGFADAAATFQLVADAIDPGLAAARHRLARLRREAPAAPAATGFPDYYADLEAMIDAFCPQGRARIVGHSMGANVAMIYAGVRPSRVAGLVNLEGFGLPRTQPIAGAGRGIAAWLDELRAPPAAGEYASIEELAARVAKRNPRLTPDLAGFIAACWSEALAGRARQAPHRCRAPARESVPVPARRNGGVLAAHRGAGAAGRGPRVRTSPGGSRRRAASSRSGLSCANWRSRRWPAPGTCCIMSAARGRAAHRGVFREHPEP